MKTILITGAHGMLGSMLSSLAEQNEYHVIKLSHTDLDITNENEVDRILTENKPYVVVNCAAYTNVEKAEEEPTFAHLINGTAVGYLAKAAAKVEAQFIHISSDYVFGDNNPNGHSEDDDPVETQLNEYAKSKRFGELEALKNNPNSYILRTSWVFGPGGKNFVDTMLLLSATRTELNIVDDEVGVPTFTKDIAAQVLYLIENKEDLKPGFYHAVSEETCTRYEQAELIFELAKKEIKLGRIKIKDYPRKAQVANFSILKNTKLPKVQSWKEAIQEYIDLER